MSFSDLPVASGRKHVKAFQLAGWSVRNRKGGSHINLIHPTIPFVLTVPDHDTVSKGTLQALVRKADLTTEQYREVFDKAN